MALFLTFNFHLLILNNLNNIYAKKSHLNRLMQVQNFHKMNIQDKVHFYKNMGCFHISRLQINSFARNCFSPNCPVVAIPDADFFCKTKRFWRNIEICPNSHSFVNCDILISTETVRSSWNWRRRKNKFCYLSLFLKTRLVSMQFY